MAGSSSTLRFGIGQIIGATLSATWAMAPSMLALSLLMIGGPQLLVAMAYQHLHLDPISALVVTGVADCLALVVEGAAVVSALEYFKGRRVGFGSGIGAGFRYFFPLFGLHVLTALGVFTGLLLFVAPGLIWATSWLVAVPARIAEPSSADSAIARSTELTKGHRCAILVLILAFLTGYLLVILLGSGVNMVSRTSNPWSAGAIIQAAGAAVVTALTDGAYEVFSGVGVVVVYLELIRIRGEAAPDTVSEIFA